MNKHLYILQVSEGFTLLEQSMVFVILGVISTSLLLYNNKLSDQEQYDKTHHKLAMIEKSLMVYYFDNILEDNTDEARFPYPAKADDELDSKNFARQAHIKELLKEQLESYYYGIVPTRTLGLADEYMFDAWGNRISFIRKKQIWGKQHKQSHVLQQPIYMLISHGRDGVNSYNKYGIKYQGIANKDIKLQKIIDNYYVADSAIVQKQNYINFIIALSGGRLLSKIFCDYLRLSQNISFSCQIMKSKLLSLCLV